MKPTTYKKLKIAVGVRGNIVFLEKFPNDEDHPYMNDFLQGLESDSTFNEAAGIYLATLDFTGGHETGYECDDGPDLEIVKLEGIALDEKPEAAL